jgi:hypothetical protein
LPDIFSHFCYGYATTCEPVPAFNRIMQPEAWLAVGLVVAAVVTTLWGNAADDAWSDHCNTSSMKDVFGVEAIDVLSTQQLMSHEHPGRDGFIVQNIQSEADQPLSVFFREIGHGAEELRSRAA